MRDLTPGVKAATTMRIIESPLNPVLMILRGWIRIFPPAAIRLASSTSDNRCCSRSAAFIIQLPDSTLAMVKKPSTIGKVIVGSGCAKLVKVKNDSESKGVGVWESWFSTIVNPTKKGSCDNGGMSMDGRGLHLYNLKSSFRLAVSWKRLAIPRSEDGWNSQFLWFYRHALCASAPCSPVFLQLSSPSGRVPRRQVWVFLFPA